MSKFAIRRWLPSMLRAPLWGDRERWGLEINTNDPCWLEWQKAYSDFYTQNQREGVGTQVNDAGYSVMEQLDLSDKRVLEIGAGDIRHIAHWNGTPQEYVLADVSTIMMEKAQARLVDKGVPFDCLLLERSERLPLMDSSIDVVVSFYSLEHLYPLGPYLDEIRRVLKPGGFLIGAIPTEGGLAWGLGRAITSRRWLRQNTQIDPDKIICWEHPNFADYIIGELGKRFSRVKCSYWPFKVPLVDANLVIRFLYRNI